MVFGFCSAVFGYKLQEDANYVSWKRFLCVSLCHHLKIKNGFLPLLVAVASCRERRLKSVIYGRSQHTDFVCSETTRRRDDPQSIKESFKSLFIGKRDHQSCHQSETSDRKLTASQTSITS